MAILQFPGCGKAQNAASDIPPEELQRPNPVQATASSINEGRQAYLSLDCGVCHGMVGDGKGVVAKDMSVDSHIHNWHDSSSLRGYTDGELFYIIIKGKRRMPGYEKAVTPQQSWAMINFIRSLSASSRTDSN